MFFKFISILATIFRLISSDIEFCSIVKNNDCIHINCNGLKTLNKFPIDYLSLTNQTFNSNSLLCSIDLTNTAIYRLDYDTIGNLNEFYKYLYKINSKLRKNHHLKLYFSQLTEIRYLNLTYLPHFALYILDSPNIQYVKNKWNYLNQNKFELVLSNVQMSSINWFNLLDSLELKLLEIRNSKLPHLSSITKNYISKTSIEEIKIIKTPIQAIDSNFFLLKFMIFTERIYLINSTIKKIEENVFNDKENFKKLYKLSIKQAQIEYLDEYSLNGLFNLEQFYMEETHIKYIDENTFVKMKNLRIVSFYNNPYLQIDYKSLWLSSLINNNPNINEIIIRNQKQKHDLCYFLAINSLLKTKNWSVNYGLFNREDLFNNSCNQNYFCNEMISNTDDYEFCKQIELLNSSECDTKLCHKSLNTTFEPFSLLNSFNNDNEIQGLKNFNLKFQLFFYVIVFSILILIFITTIYLLYYIILFHEKEHFIMEEIEFDLKADDNSKDKCKNLNKEECSEFIKRHSSLKRTRD